MAQGKGFMKIIRTFSSLDLLTKEFSEAFVFAYGNYHLSLVSLIMFSCYGSIRFQGILRLGFAWISINSLVNILILVSALATVNFKSKGTMETLRQGVTKLEAKATGTDRRLIRKEMRNLRDLRVRMGSLFHYDKCLVLTTLGILLNGSASVLLLK